MRLTPEQTIKGLRELEDFYGKRIPDSAIPAWTKRLAWLDHRDFLAAVENLTSVERYFPTPGKVLKFSDEARNRRSANETRIQNDGPTLPPQKHNPQLARDCMEFYETIFKMGGAPKWEFQISWCQAMAKKYPHVDWKPLETQAREYLNKENLRKSA